MPRRFDIEYEVYEWYNEDYDSDVNCNQRVNWTGKFKFCWWQFPNIWSALKARDGCYFKFEEKTWLAYFAEKSKFDCQRFC